MGKEVATSQPTANEIAVAGEFSEYAGAGMENVGASDVLIPRLTILQALSPQLNSKKAEFIDGAKIGDVCDVGTGELFVEGIAFLPVYYIKQYLEWAPRASGKGLVKIHNDPSILDSCTRNEKNQPITAEGNLISETAQWFGLNLTADCRKSFIPMASTQLKKSRKWMTLATGEKLERGDGTKFTPPLFYRSYNLTTAEETNNEGDWAGWKIERGPTLPELKNLSYDQEEIKRQALELREAMLAGAARADTTGMDGASSEASADEDGKTIDHEEGAM